MFWDVYLAVEVALCVRAKLRGTCGLSFLYSVEGRIPYGLLLFATDRRAQDCRPCLF